VFCQLVYLRHCIPGRIRRALDELPETLDETYARSLDEIEEQNWEYAHRLFQCVAVASRPLYVNELAEFLAFDFEAGSTPTFLADWRPEDPTHTVLSMCSSLLAVIKPHGGSPFVQFAHFSVKEYLASARLAKAKDSISRFYVSMTPAHTIVAQACLGVLLHIDKNITKNSLENFPLAEYAAMYWVHHARFKDVLSKVQDGTKRLFDPSKVHFSVWVWVCDPQYPRRPSERSERPGKARETPLHYAAFIGMHDVAAFLIVEHSQDVNARGFEMKGTPLHVALQHGHTAVARLLLKHGADAKARDKDENTPLLLASRYGNVEVVRILLDDGADTEARDNRKCTSLLLASKYGCVGAVRALLEHGSDTKARDPRKRTSLFLASKYGHVEVVRTLLEHDSDTEALDIFETTPLLLASEVGQAEVAQVLLEHGADAEARDHRKSTPLLLASENRHEEVARVLLEHGVDTEARNILERTPLLLASLFGFSEVAQVLLEHGADAKARGMKTRTSLHMASEHGHVRATRVLLEHGVDANARDANNATPLHLASRPIYKHKGHPDVVRLLLQYGSDIHAQDDNGQTPLMGATAKGDPIIMQLLSGYGEEDHRM
jgi:ankyrin repeat protein